MGLAGATGGVWTTAAVCLAALVAFMVGDLAITWLRLRVGLGIDPREELRRVRLAVPRRRGPGLHRLPGGARRRRASAAAARGPAAGRAAGAVRPRAARPDRERARAPARRAGEPRAAADDRAQLVGLHHDRRPRREDRDADRHRRAALRRRRSPSKARRCWTSCTSTTRRRCARSSPRVAEKPDVPQEAEWRMRYADGSFRHVAAAATSLLDDVRVQGIVLTVRDVEDRKAFEEQLRHRAFHDALTGLANRALFYDRVEHALTRGARADTHVGVLFVDLDDFKTVNDTRGHADGDRLLQEVANRLTACLRAGDTAARLGGDEFGVLVESVTEAGALEATAARVLEALRQPVELANGVVVVSASVGMAISTIQRPRRRGVPAQGRPRDVRRQARRQAARAALRAAARGRRAERRRAVVRARRRAARRDRVRAGGPGRDHDGLPADHGPAHRPGRGLRVLVALQPRAAPHPGPVVRPGAPPRARLRARGQGDRGRAGVGGFAAGGHLPDVQL